MDRAPLERVLLDHEQRHSLCRMLEDCADRLPELPSKAMLMQIGSAIATVSAIQFPRAEAAIAALPESARPSDAALAELAHMHSLDTIHGEDLVNALWAAIHGREPPDTGKIGYMLRCYFDGCRRALAFEALLIATARAGG